MPRRLARTLLAVATLSSAMLVSHASPAGATTVSDEAGLRAAYADTVETQIDLTADIDLTDCTLTGGDLDRISATSITLDGHGFTITQTCTNERVIENGGAGELTLAAVTITGGNLTGGNGGGGVFGSGGAPVNLDGATIVGNSAPSTGGGGVNADSLIMSNSTIADNHADDFGGGVNVVTATVTNSTISGNDSDGRAGGIGGSEITLINSTVSGNSAGRIGGGVFVFTVNLTNATVVGNHAPDSANLYFETTLNTFGSVISLAQDGTNCGGGGATASTGYNFDDDGTCALGDATDVNAGDPGLDGALADNGGPTLTHLPLDGSPLIDAIPAATCSATAADQRGITRPQGPGCDIGSVEVEVLSPTEPPPPPATPVAATPQFTG